MSQTPGKVVSSAWYLMPIFLGILGGIIAWTVTKNDDPAKAKKFMIVGVILLVAEIVLVAAYYAVLIATFTL